MFGPDHVHYVPLRAMTPPGAHNLVAVGRCVDGDADALSSVRVMGPCAAMGAAAAHALDLAARARSSVRDVDPDRLHERLTANLDPPPLSAEQDCTHGAAQQLRAGHVPVGDQARAVAGARTHR